MNDGSIQFFLTTTSSIVRHTYTPKPQLCQAHYLMLEVAKFKKIHTEPFLLAGDLNSKPHGITHTYLTRGYVDARLVAPWCRHHHPHYQQHNGNNKEKEGAKEAGMNDHQRRQQENEDVEEKEDYAPLTETARQQLAGLSLHDQVQDNAPPPAPRYQLDATLNKLCRWLRILGLDVALESDTEEARRTGDGEMILFGKCRLEHRTLITTSRRLIARRDCPCDTYFISAPYLATNTSLETALVHLLKTHNVELDATTFLTRCIVCNGRIGEVHGADEKRQILHDYDAPASLLVDAGLAVYRCDTCRQGYWWNDLPTSSASRVFSTTTHLFERCIRAGVQVKMPDLGVFADVVDVEKLRREGWDGPANELLSGEHDMCALDWLRCARLECPIQRLRSAYDDDDGGELPFTNVTHDFCGTLDYILYEENRLNVTSKLYVPTTFAELADGFNDHNAHLLPSDVWPSDHLAIGARFGLSSSSQRCDCGCVPNIPGLFEMAALRKEYQEQQKKKKVAAEAQAALAASSAISE
jgi:uncharacterized protein with PIN domain